MYDPSSSSSGTPSPELSPSTSQSASWRPHTQYHPGAVVWYAGSYWRCEVGHFSHDAPNGAPNHSLHLWTPISSTRPYGQPPLDSRQSSHTPDMHQREIYAPSSSSSSHRPSLSSQPGIIAPEPRSLSPTESRESDSSPDSQTTVTARDPDPRATSSSSSSNSSVGLSSSSPPTDISSTSSASASASGPPGVYGHKSYRSNLPGMHSLGHFSAKADESLRYITARTESSKAVQEWELTDELRGKRVWRVGGLGMWAHDLDAQVEDRKIKLWREWSAEKGEQGRRDWLETAAKRTEFYMRESRGVRPIFTWRLRTPSSPFPQDALAIGHEGDGQPLFAARAWHGGGIHLGKAGPHLFRGASISYGGAEVNVDTYEVLCGQPDPTLLKWMMFRHGEEVKVEGWQPVEGGREKDGQALLVAKGEWENGEHPGKCRVMDDHAHIPWGGGEVWIRPFFILAYNSSTKR